jgi:hypothetical protein
MPGPRSGPCSPWCSGDQVKALPWVTQAIAALTEDGAPPPVDVDDVCVESALAASEILYELSGRIFSGECGPETIRPLSRPTDIDTRFAWYGGMGFNTSWGYASSYDSVPGVASHYGSVNPPEIDLGAYPVTKVTLVKIDGVTIPSAEYELRDQKRLLRLRPTASSVPTERFGWPTGQIQDLPDTQQGTFSVTYMYGQPAPASGQLAARKLAEYLVLPQLGDSTRYPARVTNISRQGVSASVVDIIDIVKTGATGIYEVDLFLRSSNPGKNQRQARVWSPDLGRPRRTASPSTS